MMKTLLAALALAAAPMVMAQTQTGAELDAKQVIAKLESAGYSAIEDIEKDDGVWEVEAINPAGQRVELDVDPISGKVLREEPDDRD